MIWLLGIYLAILLGVWALARSAALRDRRDDDLGL